MLLLDTRMGELVVGLIVGPSRPWKAWRAGLLLLYSVAAETRNVWGHDIEVEITMVSRDTNHRLGEEKQWKRDGNPNLLG